MDTDTEVSRSSFSAQLYRWLYEHFAAYRRLSWWPFLWRITLEGLVVGNAVETLLDTLFSVERFDPPFASLTKAFSSGVLVAPIIETLLLQTLPVMAARFFGGNFSVQLIAAWIFFAGVHFTNNLNSGISAGMIGGLYLAFIYTHWRQISLKHAYWITVATHALYNLTAFTALWLSGKLGS